MFGVFLFLIVVCFRTVHTLEYLVSRKLDFVFAALVLRREFEVVGYANLYALSLALVVLFHEHIGNVKGVPCNLREFRHSEQSAVFVLAENRFARYADGRPLLVVLVRFAKVVFAERSVYRFFELGRGQFDFVVLAVFEQYRVVLSDTKRKRKFARIALQVRNLRTVFDFVVVKVVSIAAVFSVRRHTHKTRLVIDFNTRVFRYGNIEPFGFFVFGHFLIPLLVFVNFRVVAVHLCTVFFRFFKRRIIEALRPRSVRRVIARRNYKVVCGLAIDNSDIPLVPIFGNAHNFIALLGFA